MPRGSGNAPTNANDLTPKSYVDTAVSNLNTIVNTKAAQTLLAAGTTSATVPGGTPVGIVAIRQ